MPGETDTKTLDIWLSTAKNPSKEKVKLANGGKIGAMEKKVYQYVIGEDNTSVGPLTEMFAEDNVTIKMVTDAAVFWHTAKLLGMELNKNLETSHNETIPVGEGVVIRGLKIGGTVHPPFKITGEFIVTGLLSGF